MRGKFARPIFSFLPAGRQVKRKGKFFGFGVCHGGRRKRSTRPACEHKRRGPAPHLAKPGVQPGAEISLNVIRSTAAHRALIWMPTLAEMQDYALMGRLRLTP